MNETIFQLGQLDETGRELSKRAGALLDARRKELAAAVVACQYEAQGAQWAVYGDIGREKAVEGVTYHLDHLAQALRFGDQTLFTDYVAWVATLFAGLNLPGDAVGVTLRCTNEVVNRMMSGDLSDAVASWLAAAARSLETPPQTPATLIPKEAPHATLASSYLAALLAGQRSRATQLILDAADSGVAIPDLYRDVFQPVQYEVGRLWQLNRLSVAEEHYCTAATQTIIARLYPRLFSPHEAAKRAVGTAVEGEQHELGMRMVTDLLEVDGWDIYYLGANTPVSSTLSIVEELEPDLLLISATITPHLGAVADLIAQVRTSLTLRGVKIMVGGRPFNLAPGLWREVGADGYAANADEAVLVANRLCATVGAA